LWIIGSGLLNDAFAQLPGDFGFPKPRVYLISVRGCIEQSLLMHTKEALRLPEDVPS
jgi:hypothetical protein